MFGLNNVHSQVKSLRKDLSQCLKNTYEAQLLTKTRIDGLLQEIKDLKVTQHELIKTSGKLIKDNKLLHEKLLMIPSKASHACNSVVSEYDERIRSLNLEIHNLYNDIHSIRQLVDTHEGLHTTCVDQSMLDEIQFVRKNQENVLVQISELREHLTGITRQIFELVKNLIIK